LYSRERGRAAHEMIIDCRPFKAHGIEVVDIAKRLMDWFSCTNGVFQLLEL
jgi:glycine dehydrogenase